MYLHRIHLDPRCREARRDLADPYQLHSTLCRAFSESGTKCPENEFLWRLEPESDSSGFPKILVQSKTLPDWGRIQVHGWLAKVEPSIDLMKRLKLDSLQMGQRYRFRLRANPSVKRDGKRQGLLQQIDQESWIVRKGQQHGFSLPRLASFDFSELEQGHVDVRVSQEKMLGGKQHTGNEIRVFSVLYDGVLMVTEPEKIKNAIASGIGPGKVMGLGMLSVAPIT